MSEPLLGSELDAMVNGYLNELSDALGRLPATQRDHLVSEIREHIAELRAERSVRDRSDMEALLNRVGLPEDIAAVALEGEDEESDPVLVPPAPALPLGQRLNVSRRTMVVVGAAAVAFIIFVVAVAGVFSDGPFHGSSSAIVTNPAGAVLPGPVPPNLPGPLMGTVPNVIGESQGAAEETMIGAGWSYTIEKTPSAAVAAGTVLAQEPAAGSTGVLRRPVVIIVSSGPTSTS
jgi:hypothetical protein